MKCYKILTGNLKIKKIVQQKLKILSSFTHLQVVPNLYEFLSSAEHKIRYFEEYWKPNRPRAPLPFFFPYYGSGPRPGVSRPQ